MPRLVHNSATGPFEIKPSDQSQWICACGLSQDLPYCDGSHKKARQEDSEKLYTYNEQRTEVVEIKD